MGWQFCPGGSRNLCLRSAAKYKFGVGGIGRIEEAPCYTHALLVVFMLFM